MNRSALPQRVESLNVFTLQQKIGAVFMAQSSVEARITTGGNTVAAASDGIRSLPAGLRIR